jgi:hypothetical protein
MIEDENGWISIDDALPSPHESVLVFLKGDDMNYCPSAMFMTEDFDWMWDSYLGEITGCTRRYDFDQVTHWRPIVLPKCYGGENANN